jgi:hypothetical protein
MSTEACPRSEDAAAFASGDLTPEAAVAFASHQAGCAECQRAVAVARTVFTRLRQIPPVVGSRDLAPEILARIRVERDTTVSRWLRVVAWAAAVALLAGVVGLWRHRATPPAATLAAVAADSPGIERALDWLRESQEADGSWDAARWGGDPRFQPALTALPLLALLSDGDSSKEYEAVIERGVAALRGTQSAQGTFGPAFYGSAYNQALATLALLRAYARRPEPEARPAIEAALRVLVRSQGESGGWGLAGSPQPHPASTLWSVEAVQQASALGWGELHTAAERGRRWLAAQTSLDPAEGTDYFRAYFLARALERGRDAASQERLAALRGDLLQRQVRDGSWSPDDQWGRAGGRLYSTALASLALR